MDYLCLYFNVYYFIYRMASSFNHDKPCDQTTDPCCDVEDVSKSIPSPETVSSTQLPHTSPAEHFPAAAGKSQSAGQSVALTQLKCRKQKIYNVKLSDDMKECFISGVAITNDSRRLLVDRKNSKVPGHEVIIFSVIVRWSI